MDIAVSEISDVPSTLPLFPSIIVGEAIIGFLIQFEFHFHELSHLT